MNYTFELNAARRDSDYNTNNQLNKNSPIVEIFTSMAEGKPLNKYDKDINDKAVKHIKDLAVRAQNGDFSAAAELNTVRLYSVEPLLTEQLQLLSILGDFERVGAGDSIEREVPGVPDNAARFQAPNGDVTFAVPRMDKYAVAGQTISGGFVIDYRRVAAGDMSGEARGMESVRRDIMNKATLYVLKKIYNSVKNATGVKYFAEAAGIPATSIDPVITKVRRHGRPSILGSYANVSQLAQTITVGNILIMSEKALEELRKIGYLGEYKGAAVREVPAGIDYGTIKDGDFATVYPEGLVLIVPTGVNSPVKSWVRGGLTSLTGNDVATGHVLTRFDLEVAADVAKGHEHKIGLYNNTTLSPATDYTI